MFGTFEFRSFDIVSDFGFRGYPFGMLRAKFLSIYFVRAIYLLPPQCGTGMAQRPIFYA